MVSLLFTNIGLGVVTRAAPSLNIFAVGFPAMIIAGFLILIVSMESKMVIVLLHNPTDINFMIC
jgi:flagellar biosynthetic protein FliR